ncbi:venom serine carboxypeptidase-like, partial [Choristoneura fumiferana]|uniref:venom serine carboxypeptidase-like n=1 Tax=Choristoneura fumiferana TaxID=7141 RepID=UPI003D157536
TPVSLRNLTWTEDYSVLYIDNPVGTGFSFTGDDHGYTTNEEQVGEQLLEFLNQFLKVFPELKSRPLFIAGESYAGKYVPALGHQIQKQRHCCHHDINLKGLMIGNGLVDPLSMLHHSELVRVLGVLTDEQSEAVGAIQSEAAKYVKAGRMVDAAQKFNESIEYIKHHSSVDIMNMNKNPTTSGYGFRDFLERADIRKALHVSNVSFDVDNQLVYEKMLPDFMNSTKSWVEELLEDYGVLSYSGQLDLLLPYWGSKHLYSSLQWSGREQYQKSPKILLRLTEDGPVVGYKKTGGNFTEVLIRNAGHMVPKESPRVAKFMLDDFIQEYASVQ